MSPARTNLRLSSVEGVGVVAAIAVGSALTSFDATVINVALPTLGADLGANFSGLQWTVDVYLLLYGALLLSSGSLADRVGRQRLWLIGLSVFGAASLACGLAPDMRVMLCGRALQGVGAALMTPCSLAILHDTLHPADRDRAIGVWTGASGLGAVLGPVTGGALVQYGHWRLAFLLNLPLILASVALTWRFVPRSASKGDSRAVDWLGTSLVTLAPGGLVYALIEGPTHGLMSGSVLGGVAVSAVAFTLWRLREAASPRPMVPREVWRNVGFLAVNAVTVGLYFAFGGLSFSFVLAVQEAWHYPAVYAGAAVMPVMLLMLGLSPVAGALTGRFGPRVLITGGMAALGLGLAQLAVAFPSAPDLVRIAPGIALVGVGIAFALAPLSSAVVRSVVVNHAGVAAGVNTAVARLSMLAAVAVLPLLGNVDEVAGLVEATRRSFGVSAALCLVSAGMAWFLLPQQRD